jgi:hypothetical protein
VRFAKTEEVVAPEQEDDEEGYEADSTQLISTDATAIATN